MAEEQLDVIAVGAHPDDVEIACGGTLAKLVKQGYKVGIVDLTDGEPTPLSQGPEVRLKEAAKAAETLGIHKRITLALPNRRLFDCFEARVALACEFRRFRPSLVIGFGSKTPMASPDHYQAMHITDAAVFYSRLTKWDSHFENLPVHRIKKHVYFRLGFEMPVELINTGSVTVDISDTFEQKMKSIECYQSQFPKEKEYVFDRIRAGGLVVGAAAGFKAGELFVPTQPVASHNLMELLSIS